ncbi:MAG TPA: multidrug effflux MFS transporter, partial [Dongiaceae bacterium]|nr:multidrug effflux MFS transporter [Dongiaceae bacterium]
MMKTQHLGLIAILAGLMAFAPMSIDMYLPAMPELAHVFATDTARVQNTVASFFLGFAIGQAFYGPITDRFGRKKPLYVTLTLFSLVSLGCVFAPDIDSFIVLRFLQAIAACAGVVIGRAVVRDVFESHEAVKVLGVLTLIFGLAPVLAPMIGGYLLLYFGWWAIFLVLTLFGLASLAAVILFLPETHRPEHARPLALGSILATYGHLLGQRRYLGYALCGGFGSAGMFAYITGSPHVFMEIFGVLPQHYGWFFGANAMGLVLSAQVNGWLHRHASSDAILKAVVALQALAGIVLLIDALTGFAGLWGIAVPLFAFVASLGFVSP